MLIDFLSASAPAFRSLVWAVGMTGALAGCGESFTSGQAGDAGHTGQGGQGAATGGNGAGAEASSVYGCSDGTREAFTDPGTEPDIAGCSGGFEKAGVTTAHSLEPQCNHRAGNDGAIIGGEGCSVADLCAPGWQVCPNAAEVEKASRSRGCPSDAGEEPVFWLTRQTQDSNGICVPSGTNNLVGCSQGLEISGMRVPDPSCLPLNTRLTYLDCQDPALEAWECGDSSHANQEAELVVKRNHFQGGVLCCRGPQ